MSQRPLVPTTIRTEFGEVLEDASFYDVGGADRDLTYVPGFSDMRRARDLELAAVASGKKLRHEANIAPLPVNVRWTRTRNTRGEPDGRKQIAAGNDGYRAVNKAQIGKVDWLKELPPGAVIDPDGSIRKGDTVLMVADGETAKRNAARKAVATQRMSADVGAAAGGLLDIGARTQGVEPYIKKEA
jgi:hypothetical protein